MASNIFENKNDSIPIDSTVVRYFYEKLDNQQLGDIKVWDTTTLSASFYDPTNQPMEYYQELSNSGHAHKNLEFSYPSTIGFNDKLTAYDKFIITKRYFPDAGKIHRRLLFRCMKDCIRKRRELKSVIWAYKDYLNGVVGKR